MAPSRKVRPIQCTSPRFNSHLPWDNFDPSWYLSHNYNALRDDDRQIIEIVRDFFATLDLSTKRHGIDVGTGPNLYPALTMLPLCETITLNDYAAPNVSWLRREVMSYSPSWDPFWSSLIKEPLYKSVNHPRKSLAAAARVAQASIFELPKSRWDIGTMFFVAESISSEPSEFQAAVHGFVGSLRCGAPFAAAFMENSLGYDVGAHRFPAVAITAHDVENCLVADTENLGIYRIGKTSMPLRMGYDGMILVIGKIQQ
jgi:NNMT/PNMT/TEMT family